MITKITSENRAKYEVLFKQASDALDLEAEDSIDTLEDYFSRLQQLSSTDFKFIRLPLDEEAFDININTREIAIPSSFSNGIGIQGDNLAEIVYFRVDRFFDAIDLLQNKDDSQIVIQWINANGESGLSKPCFIDIESEEGKILFGWPISSTIASTPGTVRFSVRFYKWEDDVTKEKFIYNLNTLPASIQVRQSLDFTLSNFEAEDFQEDLLTRVLDSVILGAVTADAVHFIAPGLTGHDAIKYETSENPTNEGVLPSELDSGGLMKVMAVTSDTGKISYTWYKLPLDTSDNTLQTIPDSDKHGVNLFVSATGYEFSSELSYYVQVTADSEDRTKVIGYSGNIADGDEEYFALATPVVTADNYNDRKSNLYLRFNAFQIKESEEEGERLVEGRYFVQATNQIHNSTSKTSTKDYPCYVYGPETISFVKQLPTTFEIAEPRNTTLIGDENQGGFINNAAANNRISVTIPKVENNTDSCSWKRDGEVVEENAVGAVSGGETTYTYTVDREGVYTCEITRIRNGSKTFATSASLEAVYRPLRVNRVVDLDGPSKTKPGYRFTEETQDANTLQPIFQKNAALHLTFVLPEEQADYQDKINHPTDYRSLPDLDNVEVKWYIEQGSGEGSSDIELRSDSYSATTYDSSTGVYTSILNANSVNTGTQVKCSIRYVKGTGGFSGYTSWTHPIKAVQST